MTANGATSLGSTFLRSEPDQVAIAPRLVKHGATYVPAIKKAVVGASRSCARPLSVDGRPLIGRVPGTEGLWIAAGHGPWGVSTGPDSGRLLADLLLGRLAEPPSFPGPCALRRSARLRLVDPWVAQDVHALAPYLADVIQRVAQGREERLAADLFDRRHVELDEVGYGGVDRLPMHDAMRGDVRDSSRGGVAGHVPESTPAAILTP